MPSAQKKTKLQRTVQNEPELFDYSDFEFMTASRKKNRTRSTSHINMKRRMGFLL